ncbi:Ran-specific GTPase-activating protein 30 [Escovopsis weberi]|uniref:Ran-specific GTPase-activating protein 30 n=1 Tax=Escovopsis weberi TaxID=150374 RepID=A0A0M8N0L9_ESCWE|nr:Ran-specific GTPase-activating protein 30 [Escovopsis weberi]
MDEFLSLVGVQAMRYAIRSGIALTSSYAIGQCSRLLKSVDDKRLYSELRSLQTLLHGKIKVISPAIDLVEFKSGRGNVFLESALPLAKSLQERIASLGQDIEAVAVAEERDHLATGDKSGGKLPTDQEALRKVIADIKRLLDEIDREIPLLQLAISASGESLSTSLPPGISPSRLLQASTLLIIGDTQFAQDPTRTVQIGPSFKLSIYMLFQGHATVDVEKPETGAYGLGENDRKPLWQEVIHKARVRLCRSAPRKKPQSPELAADYSYHLEVIEDLDDGRAHEDAVNARPYDGILKANIREYLPIHQISKMFYTDAGRILNIGNGPDGSNNPVLLLKRDTSAAPPRPEYAAGGEVRGAIEYKSKRDSHPNARLQADIDRQLFEEALSDSHARSSGDKVPHPGFPKHLDPEWIALEVFEEDAEGPESSDSEADEVEDSEYGSARGSPMKKRISHGRNRSSLDSGLLSQIKNISLRPSETQGKPKRAKAREAEDLTAASMAETQDFVSRSPFGAIRTSLSLVEMLIRLAGLQEFQQASHLSIPDHILTFFLEETSTTGLTGEAMWRARREAEKRMGFDPYTDSPTR